MVQATIDSYFAAGFTWANFPTWDYIRKLDLFIRTIEGHGFVNGISSTLLEHLYFFWPDALTVDFGRINIVRPTFNLCTDISTPPGFLAKNGIGNSGGSLDSNWNYSTIPHYHATFTTTFNNAILGVYVKVAVASAASQNLTYAVGTNSRLNQIFHRMTQNRIDVYLGVTNASPHTLISGGLQHNTTYGIGCRAAVPYGIINGTEVAAISGNAFPDVTQKYGGMFTGGYLGAGWLGSQWSTAQIAQWNTAIQAFSSTL